MEGPEQPLAKTAEEVRPAYNDTMMRQQKLRKNVHMDVRFRVRGVFTDDDIRREINVAEQREASLLPYPEHNIRRGVLDALRRRASLNARAKAIALARAAAPPPIAQLLPPATPVAEIQPPVLLPPPPAPLIAQQRNGGEQPLENAFQPPLGPAEICSSIAAMFPLVDPTWVEQQADKLSLAGIADFILTKADMVPLREPQQRQVAKVAPKAATAPKQPIDYFDRRLVFQYDKAHQVAVERVIGDRLRQTSLMSIRAVLRVFGWNLAPAYRALRTAVVSPEFLRALRAAPDDPTTTLTPLVPGRPVPWTVIPVTAIRILKRPRARRGDPIPAALGEEVAWVDARLGPVLGVDNFEGLGPDVTECGICYEEQPAADFSSCNAGHSFCMPCLRRQATESIYGQGAATVACLEGGCLAGFSSANLALFLSADQERRLDEQAGRQATAVLPNFYSCKYCPWGAVFDAPPEVDKVFCCGGCDASFCRFCQRDWNDQHFGLRCEELDAADADATAARTRREELLSSAVLRVCHKCGLQFQKVTGCNKMTCTCKAASCYICRAPDIDYAHFCQHLREPGKGCAKCARCSLWESLDRVDAERLQAAQNGAE